MQAGLLREEFAVVGVARRDLSETFVPRHEGRNLQGRGGAETDPRLDSFLDRVEYFQTNFDDDDAFERLKHYLVELDEEPRHARQPIVLLGGDPNTRNHCTELVWGAR